MMKDLLCFRYKKQLKFTDQIRNDLKLVESVMPPVSKARLWDNAADRVQDVSVGSRSKRQSALQINLQIRQWLALRTRHVETL